MVDTATALRDISDRTIILTGAVQPRSMRHSDIAINGQVLNAMRFDLKRRLASETMPPTRCVRSSSCVATMDSNCSNHDPEIWGVAESRRFS